MLLMGLLGTALAQDAPMPTPPAPATSVSEEERKARIAQAKELYRLGAGLYNAGRYQEAIDSFREAYALSDSEELLFNIANAQERLGDLAGSIESLRAFRPHADADQRVSIDLRISSLEERLAAQPAPIRPQPDTPVAPTATDTNLAVTPVPKNRSNAGKWVLVGTGAAVGLGFGAAATVTYLQGQDFRDAGDRDSYENVRPFNNIAVPVASVGGGLAILGLVLPSKKAVSVSASPTGSSGPHSFLGRALMRTFVVAVLLSTTASGCLGPWDPSDRAVVRIEDSIRQDTTWTSDNIYVLAEDTLVYVEGNSTLTVDAGTEVRGEPGSALIVSRDATIQARGDSGNPVVFTSAQEVGTRTPGDWGGLVLLGNAPVNKEIPRQIEGIAGDEARAQYGGTEDFADCGALQYVRVEFAGFELTNGEDGNELNGLTLGGCGRNTFIRNVQVHMGLDDGVEVFGGDVDLKNIVITGAGDDSLDWDEGWTGRAQFVIVQQYPRHPDPAIERNGDEGFEGDGFQDDDIGGAPYSAPTIVNAMILGSGDPTTSQSVMHLKEGTAAIMRNFIIAHQTDRGVDVDDDITVDRVDDLEGIGRLELTHSIFYNIGEDQLAWGPDEALGSKDDNDSGFDEESWLTNAEAANRFDQDPGLRIPDPSGNWQDDPPALWVVPAGSIAGEGAAPTPNEDFYTDADYVGPLRPGSSLGWWDGWTAFPRN